MSSTRQGRPTGRPDANDDPGDWEARLAPAGRGPRITPGPVLIVIALIASIAYVVYGITVRDPSQIPLLASGAVVLSIVFIALAAYCLRSTWRAGLEHRDGRAVLIGLVGGIAAMIGAGCAALAFIFFSLANGPKPT